ncbi:fungal-specific transcription factor domain-containing protein, partial [Dioszegia hungarica]
MLILQRACDVCRRKKIKCDGPMNSQSTSKCAHCHEYGKECTYVEAAKRRGPPKGYVEALEQRCGRLERLFQQLHPGVDLTEHIGPALDRDDFEQSTYLESLKSLHIPAYPQMKPLTAALSKSSSNTHAQPSPSSSISSPAAGPPSVASTVLGPAPWQTYERDPSRPPDDEEGNCGMDAAEHAQVAEAMNRLDIHDGSWRFHGKSSLAHLLRLFNTLKYKQDAGPTAFLERVAHIKRQEYWQVPEWEVVVANEGVRPVDYSIWPAPGFDRRLIDTYFDKVNTYLPLLNKIIFMRQYDAGSYKTSHGFAKVCLMVFANGARFVDDDERVFWPRDWAMSEEGKERLKSDADGTIRYSGGWIYMRAIMRMGRSIAQGPNLYDFQTQVLFCAFLQGAAVPHLMWVLSGLGLRSAQEIGIHVRSTLLLANPIERALYNRAFWCLYHIDRVNCAAIGRSVALQDTDFDADYPIPVDDEYWSTGDPEADFVQPERAGIPKVAAFVHMLKLDHVLGAALRTIYAINKLPEHHADTVSQRAVVVELDSALNAWADSVPDGLRWDPTRADQTLFEQSAMLYSQYYFCQILIHRPFIPTPAKLETIGLPSLAICSNAARSIANILDALLRRGRRFGALPGQAVNIHFLLPAWTAAVILLVSIYSAKQQKADRERAMLDVRRCIAATKEMEMTWRQAGKLTDVLTELASE